MHKYVYGKKIQYLNLFFGSITDNTFARVKTTVVLYWLFFMRVVFKTHFSNLECLAASERLISPNHNCKMISSFWAFFEFNSE